MLKTRNPDRILFPNYGAAVPIWEILAINEKLTWRVNYFLILDKKTAP